MFDDDTALIEAVDAAHQEVGSAQLRMLRLLGDLDRDGSWEASGARDAAHWLSMRYGVSTWKAQRWLGAARALPSLPLVAAGWGSTRCSSSAGSPTRAPRPT